MPIDETKRGPQVANEIASKFFMADSSIEAKAEILGRVFLALRLYRKNHPKCVNSFACAICKLADTTAFEIEGVAK